MATHLQRIRSPTTMMKHGMMDHSILYFQWICTLHYKSTYAGDLLRSTLYCIFCKICWSPPEEHVCSGEQYIVVFDEIAEAAIKTHMLGNLLRSKIYCIFQFILVSFNSSADVFHEMLGISILSCWSSLLIHTIYNDRHTWDLLRRLL